MADGVLGRDDIEFLLDIARHDPDARCRIAALRAVAALPLAEPARAAAAGVVQGLLNHPAAAVAEAARHAADGLIPVPTPPSSARPSAGQPAELASTVRDRLLARTGFPAQLTALGDLSDLESRRLLTDLLTQLLTADQPAGEATERLGRVLQTLRRDGSRVVTASLPPLPLDSVPASRSWLGGLLALVEPAEILRLARDRLTAPDSGQRRTALRRLAAVAPYLGRPPLPLPAPAGPPHELARLVDLLESALAWPPHPTRGWWAGPAGSAERAAPPPVRGQIPHAPRPPGTPSLPCTRTVYARLDAPDRVDPGETFELRVGLAETPSGGVIQPAPFGVPDAPFRLTVQIVAEGFRILGNSGHRREIPVSPRDPFPYEVVRLVALEGFAPARIIVVEYTIEGRLLGYAMRAVLVAADAAVQPTPASAGAQGGVWVLPEDDENRPDLEIVIAPGNDLAGVELSWLCRSRHTSLMIPPGPFHSRLGDRADYAKEAVRGIQDRRDAGDLADYLNGIGLTVQSAVPPQVWQALRDVAAVSRPPTVLLASWEPYVPWELAIVPQRWDVNAPPFLGAQAVIGRWTYSERLRTPGPPTELALATMAVVTGDYQGSLSLPQADVEAQGIRASYGAGTLEAATRSVLDCLKGTPKVDALHFALHGSSGSAGTNEGFLMADRTYLSPLSVKGVGVVLNGQPSAVRMAFLNACQLGQGRQLLGEYAGMAAAFLGLGVGAVVAPLWKVDDTVAREVAESFYAAVLAEDGISPAEQLRKERIATAGKEGSPAGTRLAYLYFGHPRLRVTWTGIRGGDRG
jgi:hypothetical protein